MRRPPGRGRYHSRPSPPSLAALARTIRAVARSQSLAHSVTDCPLALSARGRGASKKTPTRSKDVRGTLCLLPARPPRVESEGGPAPEARTQRPGPLGLSPRPMKKGSPRRAGNPLGQGWIFSCGYLPFCLGGPVSCVAGETPPERGGLTATHGTGYYCVATMND